jgi:O-antigen/teichoic acid export membrane protein
MAPVMPIMFLDHVCDAMLKGIGEHVYSMWVNIADSFLSIVLVWFLLPCMGIGGYALVIIIMEAFNFTLSVIRLKKRVSIRISVIRSVALPFVSAIISALVSRRIFLNMGALTPPVLLFSEILFATCAFVFCYQLFTFISLKRKKHRKRSEC